MIIYTGQRGNRVGFVCGTTVGGTVHLYSSRLLVHFAAFVFGVRVAYVWACNFVCRFFVIYK